jgi:hypothetical protein
MGRRAVTRPTPSVAISTPLSASITSVPVAVIAMRLPVCAAVVAPRRGGGGVGVAVRAGGRGATEELQPAIHASASKLLCTATGHHEVARGCVVHIIATNRSKSPSSGPRRIMNELEPFSSTM